MPPMGYSADVDVPNSTIWGVTRERRARAASWVRRAFLVLVLLFVIAGLAGFLGLRTQTASASGGGYQLQLQYARIARPGMDVPWQLTITRPGGFHGEQVTVEVSSSYMDIFESQGISPEPSKETQDAQWWRMTFDSPPGDTLVVSFDIYVQPFSQKGRSGTARVLSHGAPAASLDFTTTLVP